MFTNKLCDDRLKEYEKNKSFNENEIDLRYLEPYSMPLTEITNKLSNLSFIRSQYLASKNQLKVLIPYVQINQDLALDNSVVIYNHMSQKQPKHSTK